MHLVFGRWRLILFGCALVVTAACSQRGNASRSAAAPPTVFVNRPDATRRRRDHARHGRNPCRLFRDRAPNTVGAFALLAGDAFYDGTTFHRIIPGSVNQGGDSRNRDPRDDGDGGADFQLKAEFNDVDHRRGVVAMARATGPDSPAVSSSSASSIGPSSTRLHAFGRVIAGMDAADRIAAVPRDEFGRRGKPDRLRGCRIDSCASIGRRQGCGAGGAAGTAASPPVSGRHRARAPLPTRAVHRELHRVIPAKASCCLVQ